MLIIKLWEVDNIVRKIDIRLNILIVIFCNIVLYFDVCKN